MAYKTVDLDAFFMTRNELASKNPSKSNLQGMDKVLQEVVKRRNNVALENEATATTVVEEKPQETKTKQEKGK